MFVGVLGGTLADTAEDGSYLPVNRYFTVESPVPRPALECLVGVDSADTSELYKVRCDEAWRITVKLDKKKMNSMYAEKHISDQDRIRREVRFGIQGSGIKYEAKHQWKNWTDVSNWVCSYHPILNTVIFDCLPENQAPGWWKKPLMGPAFPSGMVGAVKEPRSPGCNGGVCYCNDKNFCNDRNQADPRPECPDYMEHHQWDVRCQKTQEEPSK